MSAFASSRDIAFEDFANWFETSAPVREMKSFVDQHLAKESPEAVEAAVQERLRLVGYRVDELAQEVAQVQQAAVALHSVGIYGGEEQDLWQSAQRLFERLASAGEAQRSELVELSEALSAAVDKGGPAALLEASVRTQQGLLIKDIEDLEKGSRDDLHELKVALGRIVELRGSVNDEPDAVAPTLLPPPRAVPVEDEEAVSRRLRLLDREMRRRRGKLPPTGHIGSTGPPMLTGRQQGSYYAKGPADPAAASAAAVSSAGGVVYGQAPRHQPTGTTLGAQAAPGEQQVYPGSRKEGSDAQAQPQQLSRGRNSPNPSTRSGRSADQEVAAVAAAHAAAEPQAAELQETLEPEEDTSGYVFVVAVHAYAPEIQGDTQMLTLNVGDELFAMPLDEEQGWQYGRKVSDGTEGWFPPSYVQPKS